MTLMQLACQCITIPKTLNLTGFAGYFCTVHLQKFLQHSVKSKNLYPSSPEFLLYFPILLCN